MSTPVTLPNALESLSHQQQQGILRLACDSLFATIQGSELTCDESVADAGEIPLLGAFVTVKRQGKLRGCCGFLGEGVRLFDAVVHAAQRTAREDPRFPPLSARELPFLDVDVWLLHNLQRITSSGEARREAVVIGKHGLQIALGAARGLLLPGVAVERQLDAEAFLQLVSLKAELPGRAWTEPDAELFTFEGRSIHGPAADYLQTEIEEKSPLFANFPFSIQEKDLVALGDFCRRNLLALLGGQTPQYFAFGLADANVNGVSVSLLDANGVEFLQADRVSLRNNLPLQSTLYALVESLASALHRKQVTIAQLNGARAAVSIMNDPVVHGDLSDPDLRGIDPQVHMLLVCERKRMAGVFRPAASGKQLLAEAADSAKVTTPEVAQLISMPILSTAPELKIIHVPQAIHATTARQPAVAGKFFPAEPDELRDLVDACFPPTPAEALPWPAAMVPHAGLIYSGHIAADTLRRIRIPSTVIIIGPKHTPYGVEWAVAPHESWIIPGVSIAGDPALARRLADAIPGLELDSAAHAQEHAIEVELPFLARLAPRAKVVGIAIGGGNLSRCRQFAAGLTKVLQALPEQPLLLISSDMNHFAADAENRRLDEMALGALESLDTERFYNTIKDHQISMCGYLPAVIVMETLQRLGQLNRMQRVAYATSADVSQDTSRVVGYAGMLIGQPAF